MQVNISARHGELTGHDQQVIQEKAEKVRRLFDRVNAVEVIVDFQQKGATMVEINVSAEHAPDFVAKASAPTVLSALDGAIQKVEQQLRKFKEKLTGHKAPGVKHIPAADQPE
ncbi:MAG: RNA polymerase subunit sigma-54 [Pirellulaceae bacterium]|nr:MAG: RNA polymerase subunit sigma-54 [Pirellulaceae bacterium]